MAAAAAASAAVPAAARAAAPKARPVARTMRAEAASNERFADKQKEGDVRSKNIVAAKGESDRAPHQPQCTVSCISMRPADGATAQAWLAAAGSHEGPDDAFQGAAR